MNNNKWDLVIKSENNIFKFDFKSLWAYRDLLLLLVKRDYTSFYKQTILGPFWFFGQPLVTAFVYVFIFGRVAKLPTDEIPLPLFYITGITAWVLFADIMRKTSTTFLDNITVFSKVYFPRLIMPISGAISSLIKYLFQLILVLLIILIYNIIGNQVIPNTYLILFPFIILVIMIQGLGFGLIIASITVKYRDLSFALSFGVQLLMFGTTVVYPLSSLSGISKTIVSFHPTTHLLEGIRMGFFGRSSFVLSDLSYPIILAFTVLIIGILLFNNVERNFVDSV